MAQALSGASLSNAARGDMIREAASPPDDFQLVEVEAARGPQTAGGLEHVSVAVRRVLKRTLSLYRARIGNDDR